MRISIPASVASFAQRGPLTHRAGRLHSSWWLLVEHNIHYRTAMAQKNLLPDLLPSLFRGHCRWSISLIRLITISHDDTWKNIPSAVYGGASRTLTTSRFGQYRDFASTFSSATGQNNALLIRTPSRCSSRSLVLRVRKAIEKSSSPSEEI